MKKPYITPQAEVFELRAESMLALSNVQIGDGEVNESWSNKKNGGWNSSDWSDSDAEE